MSLQSCLTLCNPIDGSPPGFSVPGILQARILEWVAISLSNACTRAKSIQSCLTLCNPMDSSPPGSSIQRILQARILEWVAISFSKIYARLILFATVKKKNQSLSHVPTLWDTVDCSLPDFSVHEIVQARILEWVAIPFSRGSFRTRDQTQVSCTAGKSNRLSHQGSPLFATLCINVINSLSKIVSC